jgi:phosphate-selective porin OprO and OprP
MKRKLMSMACLLGLAPMGTYAAEQDEHKALLELIRAQELRIKQLEDRLSAAPPSKASDGAQSGAPGADRAPSTSSVIAKDSAGRPENDLKVTWGNGAPSFGKADGSFTIKPRGRLLIDADSTFNSDLPDRNINTSGLRGARLGVEGTYARQGIYQLEADFADGQIAVMGAFLGYQGKLLGKDYDLRVGHMFNDRSLEGQTGSLTTPFIERNFVANAILPQSSFYAMGTMARMYGGNWHASLAITGDPVNDRYNINDVLTIASRAHWNPIKSERTTLHLGAWAFHEDISDDEASFTRGTIIGARFDSLLRVATGPLPNARGSTGYGIELAALHDNLYTWVEAGQRDLRFMPGGEVSDFSADAWAVSGGWYITGERAPYSSRQGNFSAPKIRRSLASGGVGAIELIARHERLDYAETPLGGTGRESTIGINWYPVPLVRLMLNWSHWSVDNRVAPLIGRDDGDSVTARAQFNF